MTLLLLEKRRTVSNCNYFTVYMNFSFLHFQYWQIVAKYTLKLECYLISYMLVLLINTFIEDFDCTLTNSFTQSTVPWILVAIQATSSTFRTSLVDYLSSISNTPNYSPSYIPTASQGWTHLIRLIIVQEEEPRWSGRCTRVSGVSSTPKTSANGAQQILLLIKSRPDLPTCTSSKSSGARYITREGS